MPRCCARPPGSTQRMAPADARFNMVVGCNRTTATGVALRDGDFEYEYSLQGDGTVPIELARLAGARHSYVECGHSDMPLSDRVIAGTVDLLETGATQRFAAAPPREARRAHARARRRAARAVPGQDRLAAHDAGAAPAVPRHAQRSRRGAARIGGRSVPRAARPLTVRVLRRRRGQCARRGHRGRGAARRAARAAPRPTSTSGWAASSATGCSIASSAATPASITPIPRSLQRKRRGAGRTSYLLVGLGRFDRLSLDVIEHAAENLARFAEAPPYRSLATVAWGAARGHRARRIRSRRSCAACCARAPPGRPALTRVDLHVLNARRRAARCTRGSRTS